MRKQVLVTADRGETRVAILEFEDYFRPLVARRRTQPGNDLLSALVQAEEQGNLLSEQELLSTLTMVLFGGHETMTNLVGNGLLALLRHPDQWELLAREPERADLYYEGLRRAEVPPARDVLDAVPEWAR